MTIDDCVLLPDIGKYRKWISSFAKRDVPLSDVAHPFPKPSASNYSAVADTRSKRGQRPTAQSVAVSGWQDLARTAYSGVAQQFGISALLPG